MINHRRDDRGEVSAQLVILIPVVWFLAMIALQVALQAHVAHVATASASHAASVVASAEGTASQARSAARQMVRDLGAELATSPRVAATSDAIVVAVELRVPRLVPLFPRTVRREVTEPKERLLREWER